MILLFWCSIVKSFFISKCDLNGQGPKELDNGCKSGLNYKLTIIIQQNLVFRNSSIMNIGEIEGTVKISIVKNWKKYPNIDKNLYRKLSRIEKYRKLG